MWEELQTVDFKALTKQVNSDIPISFGRDAQSTNTVVP
jgi:hypothetical protein